MVVIERYLDTLERELRNYRVPVIDLIAVQTSDPYRILIATILSSRTKDEVTATASARLFAQAPDAQSLALLSEDEISRLIYPVGFYQSKAKHLATTATLLLDKYHGQVPETLEQLLTLPGVGRKTANLVLSVAFDVAAICVDTHVHRIMNIWGYVDTNTPADTEQSLRAKLPVTYWKKVNRLLVAFGQAICKPVGPHCDVCVLLGDCPQIGVVPRRNVVQRRSNDA